MDMRPSEAPHKRAAPQPPRMNVHKAFHRRKSMCWLCVSIKPDRGKTAADQTSAGRRAPVVRRERDDELAARGLVHDRSTPCRTDLRWVSGRSIPVLDANDVSARDIVVIASQGPEHRSPIKAGQRVLKSRIPRAIYAPSMIDFAYAPRFASGLLRRVVDISPFGARPVTRSHLKACPGRQSRYSARFA